MSVDRLLYISSLDSLTDISIICNHIFPAFHPIGELGNRSAEGQTFCNMGFAYSQLKDYDHAKNRFSQAIQASIDTNDTRSHWQASEGLAAVYFLQGDYRKAVENYKIALGSLSSSGDMSAEHNERIVNKLADAMKFQLAQGKSDNWQRNRSHRRSKGSKSSPQNGREEVDMGKFYRRVGKTRERKENHRLIARGLVGDEVTESEDSDSGSTLSSSSSGSESDPEFKGERVRYVSTPKEKRKKEHGQKNLTDSRPELLLSGPYQKLIQNKRPSTDDNEGYEEPMDDNVVPAKNRSPKADYSVEMPRSHREAYLASIANSSPEHIKGSKSVSLDEPPPTQSKTCAIQ